MLGQKRIRQSMARSVTILTLLASNEECGRHTIYYFSNKKKVIGPEKKLEVAKRLTIMTVMTELTVKILTNNVQVLILLLYK